ncbi:hypothetical protein [Zongyangia hominis]|nr:hypothetical protein [Zongyangia hominis]
MVLKAKFNVETVFGLGGVRQLAGISLLPNSLCVPNGGKLQ